MASLVSRVQGTFSHSLVFLLLAFSLCFSTQINADAQTKDKPPPIVPRSFADLQNLMAMDQPPDIALPQEQVRAFTHKPRIPEKYDITMIGQRRVDRGVNMYSVDQEQTMGRRMAEEIESQCRLLKDPVVLHYVNELGQRLARNSDAKIPFVIKVVDSDEVNAFALPGGYFYVNTGLILAAQNEAELAAVMAHEIAHVSARHATRNMTRMQIWNIVSIPMVFFGGPVGMALRQVSSVAFPVSVMKFSRDAEREADLLGIEYEYASGYDPVAFVNFFERLKASEGKRNFMANAFATHPMTRDRIQRAQREIATMLPPRDDYIVDTSQFEEVQARLLDDIGEKPVLIRGDSRNGKNDGPVLRRRTGSENPVPGDTPVSQN
jgi:Zn-dependent protease with chaperone function